LTTVTSEALKYDVITCTPYEGLNYTILDKITPLWKRIGEAPKIQIGCYRGDPGHQRHSGLIIRFVLTEQNRSTLASLKFPFAFILAGIRRCSVTLCNNK